MLIKFKRIISHDIEDIGGHLLKPTFKEKGGSNPGWFTCSSEDNDIRVLAIQKCTPLESRHEPFDTNSLPKLY